MNFVDLPADANHFGSRLGSSVRYICRHTTEGFDSRAWLSTSSPADNPVSAHYLLRNENGVGVCYRIVGEQNAAFTQGAVAGIPTSPLIVGAYNSQGIWIPNPNLAAIAYEIEGYAQGPVDPVLVALAVELEADIRTRYPVPAIGHYEISPGNRSDPGVYTQAIEEAQMAFSPEDKAYLDAKVDVIVAALVAVARREMRGADPGTAGNDTPLVAGEQINKTTAK